MSMEHNKSYDLENMLAKSMLKAPDRIVDKIMTALPDTIPAAGVMDRVISFWPRDRWIMPAFAGAAATLLVAAGIYLGLSKAFSDTVLVTFQIKAPEARKIELVGTFNDWEPGQISLRKRNDKDTWTVSVRLNQGRHEYMFLVDGKHWITDPSATFYRPDGFGKKNAVIEI